MKKNLTFHYKLLQATHFVLFCAALSFGIVQLKAAGHTDQLFLGIASTCLAAAATLAQPIWGFLSDRLGKVKPIIIACCIVPLPLYLLLMKFGQTPWVALVIFVGLGITIQSMYGLIDSWATKLIHEGYYIDYGSSRGIGSIVYAITSLIFGFLFEKFVLMTTPIFFIVFLPILIYAVCKIPSPAMCAKKEDELKISQAAKHLFKNRNYVVYIICYYLSMVTMGSMNTYFPLVFEKLGGTTKQLGISFFVMAAVEMVTMFLFAKLSKRMSVKLLLTISFAFFGIKSLLIVLSPNLIMLFVVLLTQAFGFALFVPTSVAFMQKTINKKLLSTGFLLSNALSASLGQMTASMVAGFVQKQLGLNTTLFLFAIPALIASIIAAIFIKKESL